MHRAATLEDRPASKAAFRPRPPYRNPARARPGSPPIGRSLDRAPILPRPMFESLLKSIFGSKHDRDVKRAAPIVDEINRFAESYAALSEEELRGKTAEFRARLAAGETVEDLLPEAFAAVKDACRRLCGRTWQVVGITLEWQIVPYDEQLIGGLMLHEGKIAEMATGEGKTLVATMPLYLNALSGKGAHLV